jgi:Matrixin/IPT/TIG domain
MKTLSKILAGAGLCVGVAAIAALSSPADTAAFTTIGGSLGLTQRDFRVFNNFSDVTANNNTVPQSMFPGQTGAVLAIWKAETEWSSEPYAGTGAGDGASSNPVLGSGGANFDTTFQGLASSVEGKNANFHYELAGSSGGVLAFTETPISDGWRINYYSTWTWQDGPGTVSSGIDIQGVATHEFGHALGLGHSNVPGCTMQPSISGTGVSQRSIEADDIAGVQSIYGVKSATKTHIGSISGSMQIGTTLTINGSNFSATSNEVWFTKATAPDGNPVKVTGVNSSAGGTVIQVTIPSGIQDGQVLVKNSGTGNSALSDAWPIDVGGASGDPPFLSSISPTTGPAGGFTSVGLSGTGFSGTTSVTFGGNEAVSFTVNSGTSITAITPPGTLFDAVDVTVTDAEGTSTLPGAYIYTFNPTPSIDTVAPNSGSTAGGTLVTITGSSVVGVTDVKFDGVSGTGLEIDSATQLTVTTPPHAAGAVNVEADGAGTDTIAGGFTYVDTGSFVDLGPGKTGTLGDPTLTGVGDLSPGSGTGFTLTLDQAFPFEPATMFVSLSSNPSPFKGGIFYPLPILTSLAFSTDSFGQVVLPTAIPVGTPPIAVVLQFWITDPFASKGVSATNGLQCNVP